MPLPYVGIAEGDGVVATAWGTLQVAVSSAVTLRGTVTVDAATLATKQTAYDDALAAWVADGSPGSGATFDAKVQAFAELGSAQGDYDADSATLVTKESDLMSERKAFARAVANYALILGEAQDYAPSTHVARIYELVKAVAFGIAPTF